MMYDLAIIGGGPAGYSAAFEAVKHNKKIVLFEKSEIGGTCLNRGCVPTKYLSFVSERFSFIKGANAYGISAEKVCIDYAASHNAMQEKISLLRENLNSALEAKKINIIYGHAEIIDNRTIICGTDEYKAENILICTGSKTSVPFTDPERTVTSDELLNMKYVPRSLTIIGGGVTSVEFADIFAGLGSKVTICIRGDRILRKWDKELAVGLTALLKKKGISIKSGCTEDDMYSAEGDVVLFAAGREPDIDEKALNSIGIKTERGIVTDKNGRTSVSNIYAAGDAVSDSYQLAHIAMYQGKQAVRSMFLGEQTEIIPSSIRCIYVGTEIASVGMTLEQAHEAGINAVSAKQVMGSNARTLISSGERGFIKLTADTDRNIIIGAHLMCGRAGDIVSELALAINSRLTISELLSNVRPHPSYCEEITAALEKLSL